MSVQSTPCRQTLRKSDLSPARQRLLEVMQAVGYGWLNDLTFRDGDPVLTEPVQASLRVRADKPVTFPRAAELADYVLREQQIALMRLLDLQRNGRYLKLLVLNGLPSDLEHLVYQPI